ncbi:MAG: response regulator [Acidobacteriota bacterium]|nr:response regulator [Acidobacteriota bacterium]
MKRILVVGDNISARYSLRGILEHEINWRVCGAVDCKVAATRAQQLKPDLVILSMCLPVMNALAATRAVRKAIPDMPVLVFSEIVSFQLENAALAIGVNSVGSATDVLHWVRELFLQSA